jgi:carbamoyl-phosphate synthase large subunit
MRALVTSSGSLLGQGIIRSLLDSKLHPTIIACDPDPYSAGLYWTPNRRKIPTVKDSNFIEKFSGLLKEEQPDVVFIGTDTELEILSIHKEELEKTYNTKIVVSSTEVVRIADDKYLTYKFLKDNNFDAPESSLIDEVDELVKKVGFPLIVKPRVGARSVGVHLVKNETELKYALDKVPNAVIQECVATSNDEYTAGTLYFDNQCQASIVMRRELRDGNTFKAYVDSYPELNAQVKEVCEALKPFGPANFQFRLPQNGKIKIFEINSRFSGTTPLRMRVGFNEVDMVLNYLFNGEKIVQPVVPNLVILRNWTETVVQTKDII